MKRVVFTIVAFAFVGIVINVAVAWWGAMIGHGASGKAQFELIGERGDRTHAYVGWEHLGRVMIVSFRDVATDYNKDDFDAWGFPINRARLDAFFDGIDADYTEPRHSHACLMSGFPFRALTCFYSSNAGTWETRWGIKIDDSVEFFTPNAALPIKPRWSGFSLNSVMYGVVAWGVVSSLPTLLRRYVCRRRGLCVRCAYDLRDSGGGCPECGDGG